MKDAIVKRRESMRNRLKLIRGERTQAEFASDVGVFQQNINRYELGKAAPHIDFLIQLAMKEKISLNWLVMGKGKRKLA